MLLACMVGLASDLFTSVWPVATGSTPTLQAPPGGGKSTPFCGGTQQCRVASAVSIHSLEESSQQLLTFWLCAWNQKSFASGWRVLLSRPRRLWPTRIVQSGFQHHLRQGRGLQRTSGDNPNFICLDEWLPAGCLTWQLKLLTTGLAEHWCNKRCLRPLRL